MPKVFEGLVRAFAALIVTIVVSASFVIAIEWIKFCINQIDDASMKYTGMPAKVSRVSSSAEGVAQSGAVLVALVVLGILIVYFIHRPRR